MGTAADLNLFWSISEVVVVEVSGGRLYLRVSPTGARSWILIVHLGGRRREMGLWPVRTYTLADARERARECRKLVDKGIDPITHRSAEVAANEAAQAARKTFKEWATEYMRLHQPQWRNAKHTKDWPSSLERYVYPEFGDKDIGTVTKADILRVLEPIWHDKTETATRVKSRMRLVLHWAAAKGHCAPDPRLWTDVTAALPRAIQDQAHDALRGRSIRERAGDTEGCSRIVGD
jgi:hypothetical protein